jgi:hypothetical protein
MRTLFDKIANRSLNLAMHGPSRAHIRIPPYPTLYTLRLFSELQKIPAGGRQK